VGRRGQPERTRTTTISNARNTNHLHNPKTTPEPGTTEAPKSQSTKSSFPNLSDEKREDGARLPLGEGGVWGGRTASVRADTGRPKGGAEGGPEGGSEGQKADRAGDKGYLPRVRGLKLARWRRLARPFWPTAAVGAASWLRPRRPAGARRPFFLPKRPPAPISEFAALLWPSVGAGEIG
jgi:hypothetical protein